MFKVIVGVVLLSIVGVAGLAASKAEAQVPCMNPVQSRQIIPATAVYCGSQLPADGGVSVGLRNRKFLMICNSDENTGTATIKVLVTNLDGGTSPAYGATSPGDVLSKGKCERYFVTERTWAKCIASAASTIAEITECQ